MSKYISNTADSSSKIPTTDHYVIFTSDAVSGIEDGYGGFYSRSFVGYKFFPLEEKAEWLKEIEHLTLTSKSHVAALVKPAKVKVIMQVDVDLK